MINMKRFTLSTNRIHDSNANLAPFGQSTVCGCHANQKTWSSVLLLEKNQINRFFLESRNAAFWIVLLKRGVHSRVLSFRAAGDPQPVCADLLLRARRLLKCLTQKEPLLGSKNTNGKKSIQPDRTG